MISITINDPQLASLDGFKVELNAAFKPQLFVNHYGSSEIYTFTIDQNAPAKPGSAGRAGINQRIRVVRLGAKSPDDIAAIGEEGEIIALLLGDESFEGYWQRPEANAKALRGGWYFTGDTGYFDKDRDLFVTGRVDDMIITGGENVYSTEVENVVAQYPGGVATAISENARMAQSLSAEDVAERRKRAEAFLRLPPEVAGEVIVRGVENRKARVLVGADAKRMAVVERLMPVTYWNFLGRAFRR